MAQTKEARRAKAREREASLEHKAKRKLYREKKKEARKAAYRKNSDVVCAKAKLYREENKEAISAKQAAARRENKEAISAKKTAAYRVKREADLAALAAAAIANGGKVEACKAYSAADADDIYEKTVKPKMVIAGILDSSGEPIKGVTSYGGVTGTRFNVEYPDGEPVRFACSIERGREVITVNGVRPTASQMRAASFKVLKLYESPNAGLINKLEACTHLHFKNAPKAMHQGIAYGGLVPDTTGNTPFSLFITYKVGELSAEWSLAENLRTPVAKPPKRAGKAANLITHYFPGS